MSNQQPHTPNISDFREDFVTACVHSYWLRADRARDYFNRELAAIEAAAEQRGAIKAFRKTQEIIAGFEHTIDEARERDDMINTGYLIIELDAEIQDLLEGGE